MKYRLLVIFQIIFLNVFSQTVPTVNDFSTLPETYWEFTAQKPFYASPVVNDDVVYAGNLDSTLYAVDLDNGKIKWSFRTKGEIRSAVCIYNTNVYLNGGDGRIYSLG